MCRRTSWLQWEGKSPVTCCPQRPVSADALVERGARDPGVAGQERRPETGGVFRVRKGCPGWRSHSRRVARPGKRATAMDQRDGRAADGSGALGSPLSHRRLSRRGLRTLAQHPHGAGAGLRPTPKKGKPQHPWWKAAPAQGSGTHSERRPLESRAAATVSSAWTERALGQHHGGSVLPLRPTAERTGKGRSCSPCPPGALRRLGPCSRMTEAFWPQAGHPAYRALLVPRH